MTLSTFSEASSWEQLQMKIKWIKVLPHVKKIAEEKLRVAASLLRDEVELVVTSDYDTFKKLTADIAGPARGGDFVLASNPIVERYVPITAQLVKGMEVLYLPTPQQGFIEHEVAHIIIYEAVNYDAVPVFSSPYSVLSSRDILDAMGVITTFIFNGLKDILADALAFNLFPDYKSQLEIEDRNSVKRLKEQKSGILKLLDVGSRVLLAGHTSYTEASKPFWDQELAEKRDRFVETLNRKDAEEVVFYSFKKYVKAALDDINFLFKQVKTEENLRGYLCDFYLFTVRWKSDA